MKKTIVVAAAIAGLLANAGSAADLKVGVANLQKCFDEYYKTRQAEATLKDAAEAYNKERQQLIGDFQKRQEERNKLMEEIAKPEIAAAAKAEKQKEADATLQELRKKNEEIQDFDKVRRQQLQDQQNRMRGSIVKEITDQVVKIAKAQNFTLIFDSSGASMNAAPVLVYFEERLDVTLEVVRELNKNQPPPEPKTSAPKPSEPAKPAAPAAPAPAAPAPK